jgi:1-phosphatidylinositol-4-phosphate 5-kinase
VLKTISRSEFKFMKLILKNYHEFLKNRNRESLITKVLGLHKVIFYKKKHQISYKSYFCIMDNVFCTKRKIDFRFDLKGSTYGRRTVPVSSFGKFDHTMALKDLDFLDRKEKFRIGEHNKRRLLEIIRNDC